ncbi:MAG: uncharacterized protein KVP18_003308 [Porospora cf. gigantea A]|uniref:uncharacterized protein n=1 Tax=Porospora cf. gigantea A TaxID=2853593 RepID=UPI00355A0447|nr:MAG: hypothetical protein KVP18_003308 [Porospora cf. gigantea A]
MRVGFDSRCRQLLAPALLCKANPLANVELHWAGDQSCDSVVAADGPTVNLRAGKLGVPVNARVVTEIPPTDLYFEATIDRSEGLVDIGVVEPHEFGGLTKGMFYNGNLSNGSQQLLAHYGPTPKPSDVVGVLVTREGPEATVAFFINGRCLGTAFKVKVLEGEQLVPCLHVAGSATVTISATPTLPEDVHRNVPEFNTSFEGMWELTAVAVGPARTPWPLPEQCVASPPIFILQQVVDGEFSLHVVVDNAMSADLALVDTTTPRSHIIRVSPFTTSRRQAPPDFRRVEQLIASKGPGINCVEVKTSTLLLRGPEIELRLRRPTQNLDPCNYY